MIQEKYNFCIIYESYIFLTAKSNKFLNTLINSLTRKTSTSYCYNKKDIVGRMYRRVRLAAIVLDTMVAAICESGFQESLSPLCLPLNGLEPKWVWDLAGCKVAVN